MSATSHSELAVEAEADANADPRVIRSRNKVLGAATDLLVEGGPRAVTVDAVSELSGVAKSTMYRHFPSRADLLVETMRCNFPDVMTHLPEGDFETVLRTVLHEVANAMTDPAWRRIFPALMSLKATNPELEHLSEADRTSKLDLLQELLDRGIDEGILPAGTAADDNMPLLVGPIVFAVLNPEVADLHPLVDRIVDTFIGANSPG